MNIQDLPVGFVATLVEPIDISTTSPTVVLEWEENNCGPYLQNDNTSENDTLATELPVVGSFNKAKSGEDERMWLTGGALVAGKTRQVSYTATYRGGLNSQSATPTAGYSRNYREHRKGAVFTVDETWLEKQLKDDFASTTSEETVTAGEALDATSAAIPVSLHTDTKYYKYHATNYPNLQGVLERGNNIALDGEFTLKNLKGTSINHTGLTPDTLYYAENTGTITTTASGTTRFLGKARTSAILDHSVDPGVQSSTDGEITTGTDTTPKLQSAAQIKLAAETYGSANVSLEALEDITNGFAHMYGFYGNFTGATGLMSIGFPSAGQYYRAFKIFGNGTSFSSFKMALRKAGAPTDNLTFRIETDNSGEPSGTLIDANATASIAGGTLTTSLVDTTVNLAGSVTISEGTVAWLVINRSGAASSSNSFYYGYPPGGSYSSMVFSDAGNTGWEFKYNTSYAPYLVCSGIKNEGLIKNIIGLSAASSASSWPLVFFVSSATAGVSSRAVSLSLVSELTGISPGMFYTLDGQTLSERQNTSNIIFGVGVSTTSVLFNQGITIA